LTIPVLYIFQYKLGKYLLGARYGEFAPGGYSLLCLIQRGVDFLAPLLLGGIVMAPIFAVPSYFIILRIIIAIRGYKCEHSKKYP
jgi:uncharacterized protein